MNSVCSCLANKVFSSQTSEKHKMTQPEHFIFYFCNFLFTSAVFVRVEMSLDVYNAWLYAEIINSWLAWTGNASELGLLYEKKCHEIGDGINMCGSPPVAALALSRGHLLFHRRLQEYSRDVETQMLLHVLCSRCRNIMVGGWISYFRPFDVCINEREWGGCFSFQMQYRDHKEALSVIDPLRLHCCPQHTGRSVLQQYILGNDSRVQAGRTRWKCVHHYLRQQFSIKLI